MHEFAVGYNNNKTRKSVKETSGYGVRGLILHAAGLSPTLLFQIDCSFQLLKW